MALAHSPQVVTGGLSIYLDAANLRSYPGSGTTWSNLSGTTNNGTLTNGPTFNTTNGGAIVFDGTDDFVTLGDVNSNINNTFSFWVRIANINKINTLIAGTGGAYYQIRFENGGDISLVKSITVGMGTFSGFTGVVNTTYNVVVTRTSTTYSLYINGSFINTLTSSQTFTTVATAIGTNTYETGERLNGTMFCMKYYNRALSAAEVAQNFNALRGRYGI